MGVFFKDDGGVCALFPIQIQANISIVREESNERL
jgi:hypothetical protein